MKILFVNLIGLAMLLFATPVMAGEINCSPDSGNVESCAKASQSKAQAQPQSQYQSQSQPRSQSQSQSQSIVNNIYNQMPQQPQATQQPQPQPAGPSKPSFLSRVGQLLLLNHILKVPVSAVLGV